MADNLRLIKGEPFSYLLTVKNNDAVVNINDGSWSYSVKLQYQVPDGNVPVAITPSISGSTIIITLNSTQTALYSHLGTGYILIIDIRKNDESVILHNKIPVSVTNGL